MVAVPSMNTYDELVNAIVSYTGETNPDFRTSINNDVRVAEAWFRNIRLPLLKSDPENDERFRFPLVGTGDDPTENAGYVNIPSDMLEPILLYTKDPLIQFNRQGFKETQVDNYRHRYGLYSASDTVWTTYNGTFADGGPGQYILAPRPEPGKEIYMYYYRKLEGLGHDGVNITLSGTVAASHQLTLAGQAVTATTGDTAVEVANNFATLYNGNPTLAGEAVVTSTVPTVASIRIDLRTDIADVPITIANGLTYQVAQVVNQTNFLLQQAPDLYLYTVLSEAFGRIRNIDQRDYYLARRKESFDIIREADGRAEKRGGRRFKRSSFAPRKTSIFSG